MTDVRFLSVCSGIEAVSVATVPLFWRAAGFAEIDHAASAVLAHHYGSNLPGEPLATNGVPNFGDMTTIDVTRLGRVDVLAGGTPCQSFSIAGKRLSLADARGNLALAYVVLAHELARSNGLRCALWENVPGVLNTPDNAFGCFLGALVGHECAIPAIDGGKWPDAGMVSGPRARAAWIVRDAQYFGLAQRRRRVFVVVGFGDDVDPAKILFERQSVRGNFAPRRETGEGVATATGESLGGCGDGGGLIKGDVYAPALARCVATREGSSQDFESTTMIAHALRGEGFDASEDGTGRGTPIVPLRSTSKDHAVAFRVSGNNGAYATGDHVDALTTGTDKSSHLVSAQAFDLRGREGGAQFEGPHDTANIRAANGGSSRSYVACDIADTLSVGENQTTGFKGDICGTANPWAVRRLTPRECERLQGFPDDYTRIERAGKPAADGPRYKQLGNSMAVPVISWICSRIDAELSRPTRGQP